MIMHRLNKYRCERDKATKIGMKCANPTAGAYITLRRRATGMFSNSRYFATVRRAMG